MLLTALLLGQPGAHSDALHAEATPATARTVSVREIADAAGVGTRSLQRRSARSSASRPRSTCSARLERAHAALRDADPGDGTTVTEVALRFGFAHTGRLAAAYQHRYGQTPSATLRG